MKGFTFDRGYGPSRPEVVDRGVAALLAAVGVERGVALIERAFAPGSYWRGKGLTIGQIARNPDAYDRDPDHPLLRKVNGKRPPQQSDNPIFSPSSLLDVEPS
ncbi:MAG: hypothetical protein HY898_22900 [Deltaproteobacteria bacterium]|nr:hypothetical protein [Deltaproteobacteria bacterium]